MAASRSERFAFDFVLEPLEYGFCFAYKRFHRFRENVHGIAVPKEVAEGKIAFQIVQHAARQDSPFDCRKQ